MIKESVLLTRHVYYNKLYLLPKFKTISLHNKIAFFSEHHTVFTKHAYNIYFKYIKAPLLKNRIKLLARN